MRTVCLVSILVLAATACDRLDRKPEPDKPVVPPGLFPAEITELRGNVMSVAAGRSHSCAVTKQGKLLCWGSNRSGEIGSQTLGNKFSTPNEIVSNQVFTSVAAGNQVSCAISKEKQAYCWGNNGEFQLGQGATDAVNAATDAGNTAWSATPLLVKGPAGEGNLSSVESIHTGSSRVCAIVSSAGNRRAAYCWGLASVPVNKAEPGQPPKYVLAFQRTGFPEVVRDEQPSGTPADPQWNTWDSNVGGLAILDDENIQTTQLDEVRLQTKKYTPENSPQSLDARGERACVIVGVGKREARCRIGGRLGSGKDDFESTFAKVSDLPENLKDIVVGNSHSCVVTAIGEVFCWGNNRYGQVGNGKEEDKSVTKPEKVPLIRPALQISAGDFHTCAVLAADDGAAGSAWCWGKRSEGQLGPQAP